VPAAATRHQVFGCASAGEREFVLAKAWRRKTWWKAGGTYGFIYGDEIYLNSLILVRH
jgi:hypothetical protein